MRVCTYNISGAVDRDRRFYSRRGDARTRELTDRAVRTLDEIATVMEREAIDLLALQEVDVCYDGGRTVDQAAYLHDALGMSVAYQPSFDYHLGRRVNVTTGIATLATGRVDRRGTIRFSRRHLPLRARIKSRLLGAKQALHVVVETERGPLHVINAHLTHDCDRQREHELEILLDRCEELDPVLLVGDLNTTPLATRGPRMVEHAHFATDRCMEILDRRARALGERMQWNPSALSYPAGNPVIKLDYIILFSRDERLRLNPERTLDLQLSNHAPVVADLSTDGRG